MKKSASLILLFAASAFTVSAQYRTFKAPDSEWVAKPLIHNLPKAYANQPAVVLTQSEKIDYKIEGAGTSVYHVFHRTIKIVDERGIEMYSTVGIPFYSAAEIEELKARTIAPDGKVFDIPRHMFKLSQDENGAPELKFAMEGVVKNSEVEVYLKTLVPFSAFGSSYFQYPVPVLNLSFEMAYPKEFVMEQNGFNGFPNMKDTLITGRHHMKATLTEIPALKPEKFSYPLLHMMRTEWRLADFANDNGNMKRLYTWDEFAKEFYDDIFNVRDHVTPDQYFLTPKGHDLYRGDSERKAVNRFLGTIGINGSEKELDKILKIERAIKEQIMLCQVTEDHSGRLDTIISRHAATPYGYLKLFAACFAQTDVKCEIGATTDRRYHLFNSTFENWNNLSDYVFYFPNQKAYLAPINTGLRYPVLPDEVLGNTAAFCKMSTPSEPRPKVADIRSIPTTTAAENYMYLKAAVSFDRDMAPVVDAKYSFGGLESADLRNTFTVLTTDDKQKDYLQNFLAYIAKPTDLKSFEIANADPSNFNAKKPLEIAVKARGGDMTETAGGRKLVRIGALLGRHAELYDNRQRKLPVDIGHPHVTRSVITVTLPGGYRVLNLKAFKTRMEYFDAENRKIPACGFVSNATVKGNKLTITMTETYSLTHYHLADYTDFRKVMNAAADFYKLQLVLGR